MIRLLPLAFVAIASVSACGRDRCCWVSPTQHTQLVVGKVAVEKWPDCCVHYSGFGDYVFDLPKYVTKVRITAECLNPAIFSVWIGEPGTACGLKEGGNKCRLLVNETFGPNPKGKSKTTYEGIVQTGGGGVVSIHNASGASWSITEVRDPDTKAVR